MSSSGRTLSNGLRVRARIGDGTAQRPSLSRESLGRRPGRAEPHVLFPPFNGQAAYLPPIKDEGGEEGVEYAAPRLPRLRRWLVDVRKDRRFFPPQPLSFLGVAEKRGAKGPVLVRRAIERSLKEKVWQHKLAPLCTCREAFTLLRSSSGGRSYTSTACS